MNDLKKKEFNIVKNSCKLENNSTLKGNQTSSEILRSPICYLSPDWRLLPADIFGNGQQIWLTEAGCRRDWMAGKDGRSYINFYNFPFFFLYFFCFTLGRFCMSAQESQFELCKSRVSGSLGTQTASCVFGFLSQRLVVLFVSFFPSFSRLLPALLLYFSNFLTPKPSESARATLEWRPDWRHLAAAGSRLRVHNLRFIIMRLSLLPVQCRLSELQQLFVFSYLNYFFPFWRRRQRRMRRRRRRRLLFELVPSFCSFRVLFFTLLGHSHWWLAA